MFGFLKKRKHRIDESPLFDIANLQEIGKRMRQEDSFAFVNALDRSMYDARGMMFCVCDGMGGMADGKLASDTAVQCLRRSWSKACAPPRNRWYLSSAATAAARRCSG